MPVCSRGDPRGRLLGLVLEVVGDDGADDHRQHQHHIDDPADHQLLPSSNAGNSGTPIARRSSGRGGAAVRRAARSRAERARGLRAISSSPGMSAPRVRSSKLGSGDRRFRQVARAARSRLRALGEEALDDAVLERMEGDHDQPAALGKHPLRRGERVGEFVELAIDEDAERLEGPRRRMDLVGGAMARRRAPRSRRARRCRSAASRARALAMAAATARARFSSPRTAMTRARSRGSKRLTTSAALGPSPPIRMSSGPSKRKEKPRAGIVELHRGDADIEDDAVDPLRAVRGGDARRGRRSGPRPASAGRRCPATSAAPAGDRRRVAVDGDDRRAGVEDRARCSRRRRRCRR